MTTTEQLAQVSSELKEFAEKIRWRRDLTIFEKRVKFTEIEKLLDTSEEQYVESVATILKGSVSRIVKEIESALDNNDLSSLKSIRVGFHDKLVSVIHGHFVKLYLAGKKQVFEELSIKDPPTSHRFYQRYFRLKAEAIIIELEAKLKSRAILTVLAGVSANRTKKEIISEVRGLSERAGGVPSIS